MCQYRYTYATSSRVMHTFDTKKDLPTEDNEDTTEDTTEDTEDTSDSGSGGGGGGSPSVSVSSSSNTNENDTEEASTELRQEKYYVDPSAGSEMSFSLTSKNIAFEKLDVGIKKDINGLAGLAVSNMQAQEEKKKELEKSFTESNDEDSEESNQEIKHKVYQYLQVQHEKVEKEHIDNVTVDFSVEKSWLINNSIEKDDVVLLRKEEEEWNELSTENIDEDDEKVYYSSQLKGLSIFAVSGKKRPQPDKNVSANQTINLNNSENKTNVSQTNTSKDSFANVKQDGGFRIPSHFLWGGIIVIVTGLFISLVYTQRTKVKEAIIRMKPSPKKINSQKENQELGLQDIMEVIIDNGQHLFSNGSFVSIYLPYNLQVQQINLALKKIHEVQKAVTDNYRAGTSYDELFKMCKKAGWRHSLVSKLLDVTIGAGKK